MRRFVRARDLDELVASGGRASGLDAYKPYLHDRFAAGVTSARQLCAEIREQGYRGSYQTVSLYLRPLRRQQREAIAALPSRPPPITVRQVVGWLTRHPDSLTDEEAVRIKAIRGRCRELHRLAGHIAGFARLLVDRPGEPALQQWLTAAEADTRTALHTFAGGLRRDLAAVTAGLPQPTTPDQSKARSPASRRSSGKCTAAPTSTYSANASCSLEPPRYASPRVKRIGRCP